MVRKVFLSTKTAELLFFILLVILLISGNAMGAGFAIVEQSVSGLGNAYAGGAASAEDATTIFYNPAGISRLQEPELIVGTHIIMPSARFKNEGSTHVLQSITGVALTGGDSGNGAITVYVPNFYYARHLTKSLSVGLGINSPFGLETEYSEEWVGRYHAIKSELTTININPTIAYIINENLSIGIGLNFQYLKAKLSNAIDFGTIDAAGGLAAFGLAAGALGLIPQQSDGYVTLKGDSWGIGYNLGILYEFNAETRLGIAYRSRVKHKVKGDADFSNVPSGLDPYPIFKDTNAESYITLPDSLSVGLYHLLTSQLAVMADITWTNWSVFDELRFKFDNTYQADGVTTTKWKDSYRYSLGLTYMPSKQLALRTGIAYDESPIRDAKYRTPRIPDEDRLWVAFGVGYRFSKHIGIDIGYAHLFVKDPVIKKTPTGEDKLRGGLRGSYEANVNILNAQLSWRF